MEIRATEQIARQTIDGLVDDILGYINPTNDNALAPWMMALERGKEAVLALQTVCDAIAARPCMNPGQQALRAIADIDLLNPEEAAAFEAMAQETVSVADFGAVGDGTTDDTAEIQAAATACAARSRAEDLMKALDTVCKLIAARPMMHAITPESLDEAEAQRVDAAHPVTFDMAGFAGDLLGMKQKGA